jgi:hypothetical protein
MDSQGRADLRQRVKALSEELRATDAAGYAARLIEGVLRPETTPSTRTQGTDP